MRQNDCDRFLKGEWAIMITIMQLGLCIYVYLVDIIVSCLFSSVIIMIIVISPSFYLSVLLLFILILSIIVIIILS